MGMWKVSSLDGKRADNGEWETLAGPSFGGKGDHKELLEKLTNDGGKFKGVQYSLAVVRVFAPQFGKRRKFKVEEKSPAKKKAPAKKSEG